MVLFNAFSRRWMCRVEFLISDLTAAPTCAFTTFHNVQRILFFSRIELSELRCVRRTARVRQRDSVRILRHAIFCGRANRPNRAATDRYGFKSIRAFRRGFGEISPMGQMAGHFHHCRNGCANALRTCCESLRSVWRVHTVFYAVE